jgi:hypothetical protein
MAKTTRWHISSTSILTWPCADLAIAKSGARISYGELSGYLDLAAEGMVERGLGLNRSYGVLCGKTALMMALLGGMSLGMAVGDRPICGLHTIRADCAALRTSRL